MRLPELASRVRERLQDHGLTVVTIRADAREFFVRIWNPERRDHWQGTYTDFGEEFLDDPAAMVLLAAMIEDDYRQGRHQPGY